MANGLCATSEFCNYQLGIETVEVRVRGQNDWALEHGLQLCVYRLRTVRFPCVTELTTYSSFNLLLL